MRLEGKPVSDEIDDTRLSRTDDPSLLVAMLNPSEDDHAYLRAIERKGEKVGVKVDSFEADSLYHGLGIINDNVDEYSGIIVLDSTPGYSVLKRRIPDERDVDGANSSSPWFSATSDAVMEILDFYGVDLEGKHVVIVNRSRTVGRPLAEMMLSCDATVTVCHSQTKRLRRHTSMADIVVTAVGKGPLFTQPEDFKPGAVVIDVGMDKDLRGDVDFEACRVENYATNKDVGAVATSMLMAHVKEA